MLRFLSIRNLAVIEVARGRVRARPQRPDRRDRRRQVDARRRGRPAARRAGVAGAGPDRARTGRGPGDLRTGRRHRGASCGASVTAQGRSRAFIDGALATAAALQGPRHRARSICTASTNTRRCSTRRRTSTCSTQFAGLGRRARARSLARFDAMAALVARQATLRGQAGDRERRLDLVRYQLDEIERSGARARARTRTCRPTRRVLASAEQAAAALRGELRRPLRQRHGGAAGCSSQVFKRVAELAAIDATVRALPGGARRHHAALDELARVLRGYAAAIDASPERLQQVEDRLAPLERLKRKYGPTLAEVLATADRLRTRGSLVGLAGRTARRDRPRSWPRPAPRTSRLARRLSAERQCGGRGGWHGASRRELADLAMARTRVEFRFARTADSAEGRTAGPRAGSTRGSSSSRPTPARISGRWRGSPPAASSPASCSPSRRSPATDSGREDASSSTRWTRASEAGSPTWWGRGFGGWASGSRCSASRTCRRSPHTEARTWSSRRTVRAERTSTTVGRSSDPSRSHRRAGTDDWQARSHAPGARASALELAGAGERRTKAKANTGCLPRRKRKSTLTALADRIADGLDSRRCPRTYFIETIGCQMNVHDSERMAGLLEQAGYQPAAERGRGDVIVINTCSVREQGRGEALQPARRAARVPDDRGRTAGGRGRRLRGAAGRAARSCRARLTWAS